MNQADSMLFHQALFRDIYRELIGMEYAAQITAIAEDPEHTFDIHFERAMIVAQDAANAYCLRAGFAEEIPADDAKGETLIRACVPAQYRGDMPPPTGNFGAGLAPRPFTQVELASLLERLLKAVVNESGMDVEKRATQSLVDELRKSFAEEFGRAGFDVPVRTKRRKWPWETGGG